jgi:hypothetical protein
MKTPFDAPSGPRAGLPPAACPCCVVSPSGRGLPASSGAPRCCHGTTHQHPCRCVEPCMVFRSARLTSRSFPPAGACHPSLSVCAVVPAGSHRGGDEHADRILCIRATVCGALGPVARQHQMLPHQERARHGSAAGDVPGMRHLRAAAARARIAAGEACPSCTVATRHVAACPDADLVDGGLLGTRTCRGLHPTPECSAMSPVARSARPSGPLQA